MTVGELLARSEAYLSRKGVPEASANAEFLMAGALGIGRAGLHLRRESSLDRRASDRLRRWVIRRGKRIPLAYVLGTQPFLDMELKVSPGVLIPRPETEELAVLAIDWARRSGAGRMLDFGAGSGCLALALARAFPSAEVVGIDVSPKALEIARGNARRLGLSRVRFLRPSRLPEAWRADLIVSNPPYVPTGRLARLEPELSREPRLALDGGPDGLEVVREVVGLARERLRPGGALFMEIDRSRPSRVLRLLAAAGFSGGEIRRDAQGNDRFALAYRNPRSRPG